MFRKVMSIIIMLTLFLGVLTSVGYGEVRSSILTKTEAEKLAREKLNLDKDYKLGYSNLYTRDIQQRQFWNLEFEGDKNNTSIVMAADSGEIISINQWNSENHGKVITLLQGDAKDIAIDFIKSLESTRFKETEEVSVNAPTVIPFDTKINHTDNDNYHFMFVRKINGEFFSNNYFRVTVSGVDGTITSYEMKWDVASYNAEKQLISEQKARDIFEKESRLQIKYVRLNKYNKKESKNVVLTPVYVYIPKESDKIDAITGKLLSFDDLYNWNYYGYPSYRGDGALENETMAKTTMDYAEAEMIPDEGVISKEKAEQIVLNMIKGYLDTDGIKLNSSRYTNYYAGSEGKFWSVYWHSNEGMRYLSSVINAETGEVLELSYNKNQEYEPIKEIRVLEKSKDMEQNTIENERVIDILKEQVREIFPKTKDALKLELQSDNNKNQPQINASSSRYIDNIPFEDNFVRVRYDVEKREIVSLNYRWYDVELQRSNSVLDMEKASEIFYNKVGFEKYLVQLKDLEQYENEGLELPKKELLPVYSIKNFNFQYIDALTGKFLNYSGEEFDEKLNHKTQFVDIKGNPYEKDILLMDKMGILNVTEKAFKPDEYLLRKDALKWVIETGWSNKAYHIDRYYAQSDKNEDKSYFEDISKDSPYYKYIQVAIEFGILDDEDYFKPDEKITKMELTKWIINAMKQKELAKYSSIFKSPYSDSETIETQNSGYVALAKYYNIFGDKAIEGAFEPDKNLNRANFAHIMYEFIKSYQDVNR